jgi:hypothetical protein
VKLKRVERNATSPCKVICKRCSEMRREVECYADLDGKPGDFYCQECAEDMAPAQVDGLLVFAKGG